MYIYHNHIYIYKNLRLYNPLLGICKPIAFIYCYVTHCLLLLSVAEIQQQLSRVTITVIVSI